MDTRPVARSARFDRSRSYRYRLGRSWDPAGGRAAFVLLNPSAADETQDDPTLRRCLGFARHWGFGVLEVVNLFAWRSAHPRDLRRVADPVGPRNDRHIRETVQAADFVLAGWGNAGTLQGRAAAVDAVLATLPAVHCLGVTKAGQPRHPLYVPAARRPCRYAPSFRR